MPQRDLAAPRKLPLMQQRFVQEYISSPVGEQPFNATQAAIRAGYSEKTARSQGQRLLTKVYIQAAISKHLLPLTQKTDISVERVLRELARIAFSDVREVMAWGPDGVKLKKSSELSDDAAAMVAEVTETTTEHGGSMRLKVHDKKGALDSLAKYLKMIGDQKDGGNTYNDNRHLQIFANLTDQQLNDMILTVEALGAKLLEAPVEGEE